MKLKQKDFISKRQLYRRVAEEVASIRNDSQNKTNDSLLNPSTSKVVNVISCVDSDFSDTSALQNHEDMLLQSENLLISENPGVPSVLQEPKLNDNDMHVTLFTSNESENAEQELAVRLRQWAVQEKVSHVATTKLLHILACFHPNLPLDSRTLLCTPVQIKRIKVGSGHYVHMGLQNALRRFLRQHKWFTESTIKISINIDGLPLYKSSNLQLWPILGLIKTTVIRPFVIGIFCGVSKPKPLNEYFEQFINELKNIADGFIENNRRYKVEIHSIVCDAPAKAFIKCIKSPGGYFCCDKCTEEGEYIKGRVVF